MFGVKRKYCLILPLLIIVLLFSINSFAAEEGEVRSKNITMDIRDADIRDVLSTLAITLQKNIIYTEQPVNISFSINNVSPKQALQLLVNSVDMEFLESGNIILVGKKETIHQNFYTMLPITRFELHYIDPQVITQQVNRLAIPVQNVILDSTKKYIWAQGTPQALSKMRELIYVLDREENIDPEIQTVRYLELVSIDLQFITADIFASLIQQLDIPCKLIFIDANPNTVWVNADESAITDIKTLAESVDIEDNKPPEEIIENTNRIMAKKMRNITAKRLLTMISSVDIPVQIFSIDTSGYSIWMRGDQHSINLMNDLINNLDAHYSRDDVNFFTYTLNNIRASYAAKKLEFIGLDDVEVFYLNYPEFNSELFISCPADRINDVENFLRKIDIQEKKIKAIVDYSDSPSAQTRLERRRDLIVALTGIPKESFKISGNVSRNSDIHYVLWVDETPSNIDWIKAVIKAIDDPLN
ncbi:MAG: hypothetical protein GX213_00030 [Clostridiaceae bacterium]|nr:hypothetical protein [Clostridiaceae bacterium]